MKSLNQRDNKNIKKYLYILMSVLFCSYIVFLLWRVFFYAYGGYHRVVGRMMGYNLVPFKTVFAYIRNYRAVSKEIWFFNLFGNILAFMPFGFLLPTLCRDVRRLKSVVVATGVFSLLIEMTQFALGVGTFDVDDVILNTLGGAMGYLIFSILHSLLLKLYRNVDG
ncbi:glycopeptide antibiotics resistance protein [Anaerosolibacter carboniphilus]|uniref:Glycopeptide antibiotics resistance protein n=1 Tax=Anaerosolibacter carboniphilus TaxID=1417629 RepID=A0A841KUS0_9FIRM|nr:VanZ family protein [Anaerosolibacter carboniphilus]MBB6217137.1 glycopeptide antibiotics resistance protein [Anaerosolibacter carboniphilus]